MLIFRSSSLAVTSITMDEPSHLAAGYAFLTRGDTRIRLNGPILNNLIGAAPLLLEPDLNYMLKVHYSGVERSSRCRSRRSVLICEYRPGVAPDLPGAFSIHRHQTAVVGGFDLSLGA